MLFQLKYMDAETGEVTNDYESDKVIVNGDRGNFTTSMNQLSLAGTCTVAKLDSTGAVIPDSDDTTVVKGWQFTYVVTSWRADKKLPFFKTNKLNGVASTKVEHVTQGTDSLGGKFTVTFNGEAVVMDYDYNAAYV